MDIKNTNPFISLFFSCIFLGDRPSAWDLPPCRWLCSCVPQLPISLALRFPYSSRSPSCWCTNQRAEFYSPKPLHRCLPFTKYHPFITTDLLPVQPSFFASALILRHHPRGWKAFGKIELNTTRADSSDDLPSHLLIALGTLSHCFFTRQGLARQSSDRPFQDATRNWKSFGIRPARFHIHPTMADRLDLEAINIMQKIQARRFLECEYSRSPIL